jgi:mannosyl-oligosaccharide alpha-1,2-mannosidase
MISVDIFHADMKAMDGIINHLLYLSKDRNLLYVTDLGAWGTPSGDMEHLSCFLPGLLALGARLLDPEYPWLDRFSSRIRPRSPLPSDADDLRAKLDLHMRAAVGLAHTCWVMYDEMPTGIGPEIMHFLPGPLPTGTLTRRQYENLRWGPKVAEWERNGRVGPLVGTEGWDMSPLEKPEWKTRDARYLLRPEVSHDVGLDLTN